VREAASEVEIAGLVLGVLGLAFALYQIHLELQRRKRERLLGAGRPGAAPPLSKPSEHGPEAAPLPSREIPLRRRIETPYGKWDSQEIASGPAATAAVATALRKDDILRGEVRSLDSGKLHIHVLDEENYGLWRDREPFKQLHHSRDVAKAAFRVRAEADGELVVALHFSSEGGKGALVRLWAERATTVTVRHKGSGAGL
jgi:hypothetical protein